MKKILIIYGGNSYEHDISCISAKNVIKELCKLNYNFDQIYISKENKWFIIKDNSKVEILNIIDFLKRYDLVFPVMHGADGEDGKIQSFLELFKINYVGSNGESSMISMNKELTKIILNNNRIKQVPYITIKKNEKIPKKIKYPVIVKPTNGGSSIGISVAHNLNELKKSIKEAFKYDKKIIVELFIKGIELECGIVENKKIIVSDVGEIKYNQEFYDFDSKYKEKSEIIIPANINNNLKKEIQKESIKIFKLLNLKDFARLDYIYDKVNNILYFNEVNTIPGMTEASMFPLLFKPKRLDFSKLIKLIIDK